MPFHWRLDLATSGTAWVSADGPLSPWCLGRAAGGGRGSVVRSGGTAFCQGLADQGDCGVGAA